MALRPSFPLLLSAMVAAAGATLPAGGGNAQALGGQVRIPDSSVEQSDQIGRQAHTNVKIFVPSGGMANLQPPSRGAAPQAAPGAGNFETPQSLACVYRLVSVSPGQTGCNPNDATLATPSGGTKAIAIVDAFDYPTAMSDLQVFTSQFGLPAPTSANFKVVYASGTKPSADTGWGLEAALDIQWAHAMAPNAKIFLVEAASNSYGDLLKAVQVASNLVATNGGGEVSMSWGGSEFGSQKLYDSYFTKAGVVYFAAAGDDPGVIWPSTSPNVVSAGGTSVSRDGTGNFQSELAWSSTGGGPSRFENRPSYQNGISGIVGGKRGTPDIAAVADPNTGVWVYNTPYCGGWCIVGGTSASTPIWAGIVNAAGKFSTSTQAELTTVYGNLGNAAAYTDIVQGACGPGLGYITGAGWDFCTGVGSALGTTGKVRTGP